MIRNSTKRSLAGATLAVAATLAGAPDRVDAAGAAGTAKPRCVPTFDGTQWDCIPLKPRTIFVTSATYDGDLRTAGMGLNGLQGADNICNAHALEGVVPPGDYVAWLSTDGKFARDRLPPNNIGYVLPDGTRVADDKAALLDAENVPLLAPIDQDESGATVDPRTIWTGSSADGLRHWSGYNCYDWTYNGGGVEAGTAGDTRFADGDWSAKWSVICRAKLGLYCIQR